jgi:hypothetical protein
MAVPSFTVVKKGCRIFRTKMHHLEAEFKDIESTHFDLYFKMNFDNFRTYTSPRMTNTSAKAPFWADFEMNFNYETSYPHLMVAKRLTVSFFARDSSTKRDCFLGDAVLDLMTLATGPPDVQLTIRQGDMAAGWVKFLCEMEEVSECVVSAKEIVVELPQVNLSKCTIAIRTKSAEEYTINTGPPEPKTVGNNMATFKHIEKHYFGASVANFYESAGLHFDVNEGGAIGSTTKGRGMMLFSKFMKQDERTAFRPGKIDDAGSGEVLFHDVMLMDPVTEKPAGKISGLVFFDNLPLYVQMYGGKNIDGIVYDGKAIDQGTRPQPPRQAPAGAPVPEL